MRAPPETVNPCAAHGCCACCRDTAMTLTRADVDRLAGAGHRDFFVEQRDGSRTLRNVSGACVFLGEGRCTAYPVRPEGCRLYPLILDLDEDRVVRDSFCPYRQEFRFTRRDKVRLRLSIDVEEAEAEARLARRNAVLLPSQRSRQGGGGEMRFGEFLRDKGVLNDTDIQAILDAQAKTNVWFGTLAYILGYLELDAIGEILVRQQHSGARFGECAVDMGLLTRDQVERVADLQERKRVRFGELAVSLQYLDRASLAAYLTEFQQHRRP